MSRDLKDGENQKLLQSFAMPEMTSPWIQSMDHC